MRRRVYRFNLGAVKRHKRQILLPKNYEPSDFDVLCGRRRTSLHHSGNIFFRKAIVNSLKEYSAVSSTWDKSIVVNDIANKLIFNGDESLRFIQFFSEERHGLNFLMKQFAQKWVKPCWTMWSVLYYIGHRLEDDPPVAWERCYDFSPRNKPLPSVSKVLDKSFVLIRQERP